MAVAIVVVIGVLLALGLVLFTVHRLRPGVLRLKATVTKWVSLDLEMHSPEGVSRGRERPPDSPANRRV